MLEIKIPSSVLLSLATVPVLVGLLASKALSNALQEIGQASEEIFRGDRLPVLDVSTTASHLTDSDSMDD